MEGRVYPLVSIITVNFKQAPVTGALLESLRKVTYPNLEIIVVDNGSNDDQADTLVALYPECRLIKSKKNLGFAAGNNLGIRESKGDYLMFLNNDTEVDPGFLEPLVRTLMNNRKIGMASPKIRFYYAKDIIQYAGYSPMSPVTLRQQSIGYKEKDQGQHDQVRETFSGHGAAMMVPRSVVNEVGLMSEWYFLYYEEHDWAARIRKKGYVAYVVPTSLIFHKESVSTGKESPLKTFYINRNRFLFAKRNLFGLNRLLTLLYLSFVAFPKGFFSFVIQKRFDLAKALAKAYCWNFTHPFGFNDPSGNEMPQPRQ